MTDSTAFDVAHLANVELLTPKFEEGLWLFRERLAMRVVEQADGVATGWHGVTSWGGPGTTPTPSSAGQPPP